MPALVKFHAEDRPRDPPARPPADPCAPPRRRTVRRYSACAQGLTRHRGACGLTRRRQRHAVVSPPSRARDAVSRAGHHRAGKQRRAVEVALLHCKDPRVAEFGLSSDTRPDRSGPSGTTMFKRLNRSDLPSAGRLRLIGHRCSMSGPAHRRMSLTPVRATRSSSATRADANAVDRLCAARSRPAADGLYKPMLGRSRKRASIPPRGSFSLDL